VGEWIKKMYIHTREYYLALKNKEILSYAASWMNEHHLFHLLSKINQSKKDRHWMIPLI